MRGKLIVLEGTDCSGKETQTNLLIEKLRNEGLRVKKYRLDNKKSQQEVADYLGIDISTYNKYEKGSRKLNNEVVRKIAEYYNIKVSDILD